MIKTFDIESFVTEVTQAATRDKVDFQQPVKVGFMSRLNNLDWKLNSTESFSSLKLPKNLPLDLNTGFDNFANNYVENQVEK